jgi:periodic tryptophan protein 2
LTNFHRRIAIHHFSFKSRVSALKFSPSGRHFAVGVGRRVQIWQTPSTPGTETNGEIEFAPFVLHRDSAAHFDTVQSIEWSSDSRFLLSASRDLTARVWSLDKEDGFEPTTLAGHRQGVVGAYFDAAQESVRNIATTLYSSLSNVFIDLHSQPRWCPVPLGIHSKDGPRN